MPSVASHAVPSAFTIPLPDGGGAGPPATSRIGGIASVLQGTGAEAVAASLPWLAGAGGASPAAGWLVSALAGRPEGGAGYAPLVAAATSSSAKASGSGTPSPASVAPRITGEWSFLTNPALSIEDKLARFLLAVQKKMDDELTDKMEEYRAKYGEGGSETKKDDGGGIFGTILKILCPPLAIADSVFGGVDEFLAQGLKLLGGPLLAALATALGMPALAPAALQVGKGIGEAVAASRPKAPAPAKAKEPAKPSGKAGTGTASTAGKSTGAKDKAATTPAKGEAGSPDERLEMLEIQRLVEKQNQLFTLVSNVMKSMHETTMVAVQNVR